MLRYYDENNLLKPRRWIPYTGYRLYSVDQIPRLNRIVFLRDSGFNVAEITEPLNSWDDVKVIQLLENKRIQLAQNIQEQQQKNFQGSNLPWRILCRKKRYALQHHDQIRSPAVRYSLFGRLFPTIMQKAGSGKEMSAFAASRHIQITGDTFSIYHDAEYKETDVDVELCALVSRMEDSKDGFLFPEYRSEVPAWRAPWYPVHSVISQAHILRLHSGFKETVSFKCLGRAVRSSTAVRGMRKTRNITWSNYRFR